MVLRGNAANGGGAVRGIDAGNKANGVSDAVGVGAGNTPNGGVGAGKASFVAKTNSSIAARVVCVSWCSCQRSHASVVKAKSYLSSPTPKNLSKIRFLRMFYCTKAKIP